MNRPDDTQRALDEAMSEVYLGDGLYVRFDGDSVVLRAPRYDGEDHTVSLDPFTRRSFEGYLGALDLRVREASRLLARDALAAVDAEVEA